MKITVDQLQSIATKLDFRCKNKEWCEVCIVVDSGNTRIEVSHHKIREVIYFSSEIPCKDPWWQFDPYSFAEAAIEYIFGEKA